MTTPAAALAGAAPLTMPEAATLRLAQPYEWFRLTFDPDALESAPVVSRHTDPQPSPQEWECGCVTATYITDGDTRAGDRPFEMRLAIACCTGRRCGLAQEVH